MERGVGARERSESASVFRSQALLGGNPGDKHERQFLNQELPACLWDKTLDRERVSVAKAAKQVEMRKVRISYRQG